MVNEIELKNKDKISFEEFKKIMIGEVIDYKHWQNRISVKQEKTHRNKKYYEINLIFIKLFTSNTSIRPYLLLDFSLSPPLFILINLFC